MGTEDPPSVSFWNPWAQVMNNLREFQGDEEPEAVGWFHLEVVEPKKCFSAETAKLKIIPNFFSSFSCCKLVQGIG